MKYSIANKTPYDLDSLVELMHKFVPYAQKYLKFDKPIYIELVSDLENAEDLLGKTAFYSPGETKVGLFADNRHPKDILRSLSHELVHHAQYCRGEFDGEHDTSPGYITRDSHMQNMEGEAYLLGNGFIIRFFEELLKNPPGPHKISNKAPKKEMSISPEEEEIELPSPVGPQPVEEYLERRQEIIADGLLKRTIKTLPEES